MSSGFTATIDADMRLGNVQETVTVTGESPMVDVQSAAQSRAVTADEFKELPSGGSWIQMAALVPPSGRTNRTLAASWATRPERRSAPTAAARGRRLDGGRPAHREHVHQLEPDEHEPVAAALRPGGRAVVRPVAETGTNGVIMNAIPKAGGNRFSGTGSSTARRPTFRAAT